MYSMETFGRATNLTVFSVLLFLCSGGLNLVFYVFRSLSMYSIARRRELKHPWMAWVPVLNSWLLGSVSDQYQYVAKGKNCSKRKWLLGLEIANVVVLAGFWISYAVMVVQLVFAGVSDQSLDSMMTTALPTILTSLGLTLPMLGLSIAILVVRYIALYDVYCSLDPKNSVMYTVLSILIRVTEPFFLFFNREKDLGMPPRKPRTPRPERVSPPLEQPVEPAAPVQPEAPAQPEQTPVAPAPEASEPARPDAAPVEPAPEEPSDRDPWEE